MHKLFDSFRKYPELRQCVISLRSGTCFRGVIWKRTSDYLIVKNVEITHERGEIQKTKDGKFPRVDGEVFVGTNHIDFVQVL